MQVFSWSFGLSGWFRLPDRGEDFVSVGFTDFAVLSDFLHVLELLQDFGVIEALDDFVSSVFVIFVGVLFRFDQEAGFV